MIRSVAVSFCLLARCWHSCMLMSTMFGMAWFTHETRPRTWMTTRGPGPFIHKLPPG